MTKKICKNYTQKNTTYSESPLLKQEAVPHYEQWEKDGIIDRGLWKKAANLGVLGVSRLEIVESYAQKSGRSIPNLVFYYAFGLFKNAVIVQQIYYRYHKGLTTNEKFANLNQAARLFIEVAWQAIQQKRIENLF